MFAKSVNALSSGIWLDGRIDGGNALPTATFNQLSKLKVRMKEKKAGLGESALKAT
jgi:hypothetical protein